jgi:pyruvate dehydrogenase complex dehydrogenase (E1) component
MALVAEAAGLKVPGHHNLSLTAVLSWAARAPLRRHFEADGAHIVVAALHALAERGDVKAEVVADAIERFGIDADALDPRYA